MKHKLYLILFLIVADFQFLYSQYIISGKLLDVETGTELIGANIEILGTQLGTYTDIDGSFEIEVNEIRSYTIVCTYITYNDKTIEHVEVSEKVTNIGDIRMSKKEIELENVTIIGKAITNSEVAMLTLQRKSMNTIDAISSQAFSLRGDSDAASAMKRVTGVSVESGKYVYVRGLGDRYSKTTLNGANIPGLDPDKNTVQMDLFPTNLIENIVVYKNFTPDLPGDFTGGLIDITTKEFPKEFIFNASVGMRYNPQVHLSNEFLTYKGSATDWLGFDNGLRDAPNLAYNIPTINDLLSGKRTEEELKSVIFSFDNILEPFTQSQPLDHSISLSVGNQKSLGEKPLGLTASLVYNRSYSAYYDGKTERYNQTEESAPSLNKLRQLIDNKTSDEVMIGGIVAGSLKLDNSNTIGLLFTHNQTGNKSTRYQVGNVLDASGNLYQERTLNYVSRSLTSGQLKGSHNFQLGKAKLAWISAYTLSSMEQPDLRFINNVGNINGSDTTFYIDASEDKLPTRFFRKMYEYNLDNQIDFEYNILVFDREMMMKVGGNYLLKKRTFRDTLYEYSNGGNAADFNHYVTKENVFDLEENISGVIIMNNTEGRNQYDSEMSIASAYIMARLPLNSKLKLVGGVRLEHTQLNFTSYRERTNLKNITLLDQANLLSSLSLIYTVVPNKMNLRGNFSQTVARPSFREIAPVSIFDPVNNAIIQGNSNLLITEITNVDLRWEYYFKPGDMICISGFYKKFKNPIELTIEPQADNQYKFQNVELAQIYGTEFEARTGLGFIKPYFESIQIGTNITFVKSRVDIPTIELEAKRFLDKNYPSTRVMLGQSPYIINIYLQYISEGYKGSISYNIQGKRLQLVSRGLTPDLYERPFHALNAKISKSFQNGWVAAISLDNILNSSVRQSVFFKGDEYIWNSYRKGVSFKVGLAYTIR